MAKFTIKNVPTELLTRLKESAAQHRRSVNSEAIQCLEKALVGGSVGPREFLDRARILRERHPNIFLTEEDLRFAKNEGRP